MLTPPIQFSEGGTTEIPVAYLLFHNEQNPNLLSIAFEKSRCFVEKLRSSRQDETFSKFILEIYVFFFQLLNANVSPTLS